MKMEDESKEALPLTPQQKMAALELAAGARPREVAKRYRVSSSTLKRWRRLPLFLEALETEQRAVKERFLKRFEQS